MIPINDNRIRTYKVLLPTNFKLDALPVMLLFIYLFSWFKVVEYTFPKIWCPSMNENNENKKTKCNTKQVLINFLR